MILNSEIRGQFFVYIFMSDENKTVSLKSYLSQEGYDTYMFIDEDLILDAIQEQAPHVIIFDPSSTHHPLIDWTQKILNISDEIVFLPLTELSEYPLLFELRNFQFSNPVPQGKNWEQRVFWQLEMICERLYFLYQNEQFSDRETYLIDQNKEHQKKITTLEEDLHDLRTKNNIPFSIKSFLSLFSEGFTREELVDAFLRQWNSRMLAQSKKGFGFFLKHVPSLQSFVYSNGVNIDSKAFQGIGVPVRNMETALRSLMEEGLKVKNFVQMPLLTGESTSSSSWDGLFLFWDEGPSEEEFATFSLVYQNALFSKRLATLDTSDPLTQLLNSHEYQKKLAEEVSRARRIRLGVSVVKLGFDPPSQTTPLSTPTSTIPITTPSASAVSPNPGENPELLRDLIFRSLGSWIRRSSRVNDIACRSGDNELSLILPHCGHKGALIRGERLRRLVETNSFSLSGMKLSISVGVSEYPSLCSSSEDLDKSSTKALLIAQKEKGGNRVCVFKTDPLFQPEFTWASEPHQFPILSTSGPSLDLRESVPSQGSKP